MRIFKVAFVALALTLGGCANVGPAFDVLTGSVATTAPVTIGEAEKVLTVAHLAYNTVSENIITATTLGTLHGTNAATVKLWYDKAGDALLAADQLDKVANAQGVMDKVSTINTLLAQIASIVPTK